MLLPLFLVGEATRIAELWDGLRSAPGLPWQRPLPEARPLAGREGGGAGCQYAAVWRWLQSCPISCGKGLIKGSSCLLVLSLGPLVLTFLSP